MSVQSRHLSPLPTLEARREGLLSGRGEWPMVPEQRYSLLLAIETADGR